MIKKKNAILTFIFSLVPGAGEMFMGFMKQGVSLMSMFFACIAISAWVRADALAFIGIIVWCYSFFHVHNLRSLTEEEFQKVEDKIIVPFSGMNLDFQITNDKLRTAGAVALILFGASLLWNYLLDIISRILPEEFMYVLWDICYDLPEAVIGTVIIWLGVCLIKGKKKALDAEEAKAQVQNIEKPAEPNA